MCWGRGIGRVAAGSGRVGTGLDRVAVSGRMCWGVEDQPGGKRTGMLARDLTGLR